MRGVDLAAPFQATPWLAYPLQVAVSLLSAAVAGPGRWRKTAGLSIAILSLPIPWLVPESMGVYRFLLVFTSLLAVLRGIDRTRDRRPVSIGMRIWAVTAPFDTRRVTRAPPRLELGRLGAALGYGALAALGYWVALPLSLRNAVSQFEPQWQCWEPDRREDWVREPPGMAIADPSHFPFFTPGMEFEDFTPAFARWFARGQLCATLVGIRSDESLNRWRTIANATKLNYEGHRWTTWLGGNVYNAYPVYDWRTEDIWRYHGRYPIRAYNRLYDRMHRAGLTIHQARICQPYGDDQRRGLWLYHIIEPETWGRVVARVQGANQGALYIHESGNIMGQRTITKPAGHTWESFARMLLASMPPSTRDHYENKIAMFLHWYRDRGYSTGIPDDGPITNRDTPSWARVCKALLRNDYWCRGLSFSQHKSGAYLKYQKLMKRRRTAWQLI